MKNFWPDIKEGRIATKNQMGFMFLEIGGASPDFIEYAKQCTDTVIDLGAAYGVVTLSVLQHSHCQVVAFDLCPEHLDILRSATPPEHLSRLTTIPGRFPNDFNFAPDSVDAIHSSYMMHFLTGTDIEEGLNRCLQALKPGGKLYINVVSPYFKPFKNALSLYEDNVTKGLPWPGEITDLKKHLSEQDIPHAPDFIHVFKKTELQKTLLQAGFLIEKVFYYDIHEPAWFASDEKGIVAAIATKP